MTTYTDNFACTGYGTYDEDLNMVDVSTCKPVNHYRIKKGQKLFVESVYQQDELPHYGVMSMSFVYAHIPRKPVIQV